ncbi:MAG: DUF4398 domain-containing protein [Treponema sp.]|nr:DUF4398 domain-containing protein [Treponema sp.]
MKVKFMNIVFILLAGSLITGFMSCATPPTEEMNRATEAVTRAENDADAVMYAGNTLARARDALRRMQAEADSKRYDAARTLAEEATMAAERAIAEGRTGAERARQEAISLLSALKPEIGQTEQNIQSGKDARLALDFDEIDREFGTALLNADQAEVALAGDRYHDALERGRSARAGLSDINQKLTTAATEISGKK